MGDAKGTELSFTGERYLPEVSGQIAFEHLHRYYFAGALVQGMKVLDVACGEGYGSHILSRTCADVTGVDIDPDAVKHAASKYGRDNVRFVEASAAALPFDDAVFDAVVSFETIEHHDQHGQMMSHIKRVLKPGGLLIMSSPNKLHYSIEPGYSNPYHVKELYQEEFLALVRRFFVHANLLGQRVVHGSLIVAGGADAATFSSSCLDKNVLDVWSGMRRPLYDVIVASDGPLPAVGNSLFEATVHNMEAAGFYGVHLPERVAQADARILELQAQEAPMTIAEQRKLVEAFGNQAEIERLKTELGEAKARSDTLQEELLVAAKELASAQQERAMAEHARAVIEHEKAAVEHEKGAIEHEKAVVVLEKQGVEREFAILSEAFRVAVDSAERIDHIRSEQGGMQARLEIQAEHLRQKEESLSSTNARLEKLDAELLESRAYIEQLHRSRSWRATAWLRRLASYFK